MNQGKLMLIHAAGVLLLAAQAGPAAAETYSVTSPHWSHLHAADFAWALDSIADPTAQAAARTWVAARLDADGDGLKPYNPAIKDWIYQLDTFMCQHQDCEYVEAVTGDDAGLPEDYFLHYSSDTQLSFYDLAGNFITTVTVQGCPPSQPITKSCRAQIFGWHDSSWLYYNANPAFRTWMAARLLGSTQPNIDGVFLDVSGNPGFNDGGDQTHIISGGQLREYGGAVAASQWPDYSDPLDISYDADHTGALAQYYSTLNSAGKFLFINVGGYVLYSGVIEQFMASHGFNNEKMNIPMGWSSGDYAQYIKVTKNLTAEGGTANLEGSGCYWGESGYTAGAYPTSKARYDMWTLSNYYMLRESPGSPGIVYYNPEFCIDSSNPLSPLQQLQNEWDKGYETDVGQPAGDAAVYSTDVIPASCPDAFTPGAFNDGSYTIFRRAFTSALVLLRTPDGYCPNSGDLTAATVTLPQTYQMLNADGTLGPPSTTFKIRSQEALVLMKPNGVPPGTNPPASPRGLRAL